MDKKKQLKLEKIFSEFNKNEQFILRKYLREKNQDDLEKIIENGISEKEKTVVKNLGDFNWRMKNLYYITNEDGERIKFRPNFIQRRIIDSIMFGKFNYLRFIILKYRQGGVSTLFVLILLDEFLWGGTNIYNVIIAHERKLLISLFKKIRYALDNIDYVYRGFLPNMDTDNANELYIRDDNNRLAVSLDTRGETPTRLHITELAWREASKQGSLLTTVNPYRKTKITIESTANGVGNPFHNLVMKAREGKGSYKLLFYPWFIESRNRMRLPEGGIGRYTEKEKEKKLLYNLDDEQIYWRRTQIEDAMAMGKDGEKVFDQENPDSIETAFIASGANVFDLSLAYKLNKPIEIRGDFKIYGKPEDAMVFGIDTSEGGAAGDYSVIVGMSRTGKVLVTYRKKVDDFQLAEAMDQLLSLKYEGKKFLGTILIERNKGAAFVSEAKAYSWFHKYMLKGRDPTAINDDTKEYYGFFTGGGSKRLLIQDFRKGIFNSDLELTKDIYEEICTYIDKNGKAEAMSGKHDDLIMAAMIAYHGVLHEEYVVRYKNVEKDDSGLSKLEKAHQAIMSGDYSRNNYSGYEPL